MQKAKGKTGEEWTGVRNYQARNNMRLMKLGEGLLLSFDLTLPRLFLLIVSEQ
jgi:predicted RNA-binding protein with PUA-like domain